MAKGYHTYKGRSGRHSAFSIVIVFLIVLAALILLFMALQNSVVFSSEGIRFVGLFDRDVPEDTPSPSPQKSPELVIVTPDASPSPSATPTPEPVSLQPLKAVYLPDINDAVAIAGVVQLADKGVINAVVIDMKHNDGTLGFISANANAIHSGANAATSDYLAPIRDLKDAGLFLVARVSAFKDNLVPRKVQTTSVKTKNNVIWLDQTYNGWLNPYLTEAQDYVIGIITELADLGFEEILLDNYCYPTIGRPQLLYYGDYEQTSKIDTLTAFAVKCADLLAEKKVTLSIRVTSSAILNGTDSATGQDPAGLYKATNRIYTDIGIDPAIASTIYDKITETAASDDINLRFVPIITAPRSYDDPSAAENIQVAIGAFGKTNAGWVILDTSGLYPSVGW